MSEIKNNDENNTEHEVYSVPYTKAGLASKNGESDESENKNTERKDSNSSEQTPKISKEKSTERDHERPIH